MTCTVKPAEIPAACFCSLMVLLGILQLIVSNSLQLIPHKGSVFSVEWTPATHLHTSPKHRHQTDVNKNKKRLFLSQIETAIHLRAASPFKDLSLCSRFAAKGLSNKEHPLLLLQRKTMHKLFCCCLCCIQV